jgi:hypothetical protein
MPTLGVDAYDIIELPFLPCFQNARLSQIIYEGTQGFGNIKFSDSKIKFKSRLSLGLSKKLIR